nr:immunoglobulin heavy chain junction region [Macaca mulatta]
CARRNSNYDSSYNTRSAEYLEFW